MRKSTATALVAAFAASTTLGLVASGLFGTAKSVHATTTTGGIYCERCCEALCVDFFVDGKWRNGGGTASFTTGSGQLLPIDFEITYSSSGGGQTPANVVLKGTVTTTGAVGWDPMNLPYTISECDKIADLVTNPTKALEFFNQMNLFDPCFDTTIHQGYLARTIYLANNSFPGYQVPYCFKKFQARVNAIAESGFAQHVQTDCGDADNFSLVSQPWYAFYDSQIDDTVCESPTHGHTLVQLDIHGFWQ